MGSDPFTLDESLFRKLAETDSAEDVVSLQDLDEADLLAIDVILSSFGCSSLSPL